MRRYYKIWALGLVLLVFASVAGCATATPTPSPTPSPTPVPSPTPTPWDAGGPRKVQPGEQFTLDLAELVEITLDNGSAALFFEDVLNDSRCPIDAACIRAGDATVVLVGVGRDGVSHDLDILYEPGGDVSAEFDGLKVMVYDLRPYPETTKVIAREEYSAVLVVQVID